MEDKIKALEALMKQPATILTIVDVITAADAVIKSYRSERPIERHKVQVLLDKALDRERGLNSVANGILKGGKSEIVWRDKAKENGFFARQIQSLLDGDGDAG